MVLLIPKKGKSWDKLYTLRNWYFGEFGWKDEKLIRAYGNFHNRPGYPEGTYGHTSVVQSVKINHEEKEYEIQTKNNLYHCSFDSCVFERQNKSPYQLPEYEQIKAQYYKPVSIKELSIDDMILVLSDAADCYFEKLIYKNSDGSEGDYRGYANDGLYSTSYLIDGNIEPYEFGNSKHCIDIRYYVEDHYLEFYSFMTGEKKLWLENRGKTSLRIGNFGEPFELQPGEIILAMKKGKKRATKEVGMLYT